MFRVMKWVEVFYDACTPGTAKKWGFLALLGRVAVKTVM